MSKKSDMIKSNQDKRLSGVPFGKPMMTSSVGLPIKLHTEKCISTILKILKGSVQLLGICTFFGEQNFSFTLHKGDDC